MRTESLPAHSASDWPTRRFTLDEYHQLIEIGFFQPEERLELIEGIMRPESRLSPRSAETIRKMMAFFLAELSGSAHVRVRSPLTFTEESSEPEPDFALAFPRPGGYADRHPSAEDVLLAVEVAQSSLRYDREVKIPLYAAAGIREYWIVNLLDDVIEIYRQPTVLASGAAGYAEKSIHAGDDRIAPQLFPECVVAVNALIPGAT